MSTRNTARAALIAGGSLLLAATPAFAHGQQRPAQGQAAQPAAPQRQVALPKAEHAAVAPLLRAAEAAATSKDWAPVRALLPAAQAAARSNPAKYLVARVQYQMALAASDLAGQETAANALLAIPVTPADEAARLRTTLIAIQERRAEMAVDAKDYATAERIYRQLSQANPNERRLQNNLRIVQQRSGNTAGALQILSEQIRAAEAAGQRAPEDLYRRAFQTHYDARQRREAATAMQRLLKAYPSQANWRAAFDFAREGSGTETQVLLDAYRFARAANLPLERPEYVGLVQTLSRAGLPGETQAVIDAGASVPALQAAQSEIASVRSGLSGRVAADRASLAGQIQQARSAARGEQARTAADTLYGYGRYGEAAELYRLALTKGGVDTNMLNLRLGASLAMAGQRPAAETALRTVTGARADIAWLWLTWLARAQA